VTVKIKFPGAKIVRAKCRPFKNIVRQQSNGESINGDAKSDGIKNILISRFINAEFTIVLRY